MLTWIRGPQSAARVGVMRSMRRQSWISQGHDIWRMYTACIQHVYSMYMHMYNIVHDIDDIYLYIYDIYIYYDIYNVDEHHNQRTPQSLRHTFRLFEDPQVRLALTRHDQPASRSRHGVAIEKYARPGGGGISPFLRELKWGFNQDK